MKNKTNSIVVIVFAIGLTLLVLSGCEDKPQVDTNTNTQQSGSRAASGQTETDQDPVLATNDGLNTAPVKTGLTCLSIDKSYTYYIGETVIDDEKKGAIRIESSGAIFINHYSAADPNMYITYDISPDGITFIGTREKTDYGTYKGNFEDFTKVLAFALDGSCGDNWKPWVVDDSLLNPPATQ